MAGPEFSSSLATQRRRPPCPAIRPIRPTVATWVSKAWFFVLYVHRGDPPTFVFLPLDTGNLIINTLTTIITFLLVALLQNTDP